MSNQEIRAKARELYGKYFAAVFLIGLCSENVENVLFGVFEAYFGELSILFNLLAQLLLIPLIVGAIGCIEPLWTSEQVRFERLFAFYTPVSRFGQSMLLGIIPIMASLLTLVSGILLVALRGYVLLYILLMFVLLWLLMRLEMAIMLFASGRYTKALDAFAASYQKMRGRLFDLLAMTVVVLIPQVLIMEILQALSEQNNGLWIFTVLQIVFIMLYAPYSTLALQGWVLEQIKDSEQPQESENKRNQSPFLPEIKKEVEPSSKKLGDQ